MPTGAPGPLGTQLKALREAAGFTQDELATIAGISIHAVSALERGERRRPHPETLRALSAALDLTGIAREALFTSARASRDTAVGELTRATLPNPVTSLLGREHDIVTLGQWLADTTARLITLVGPGGVGKTRLALEVARQFDEEGTARVVFVSLASVSDSTRVPAAIAEAFGLAEAAAAELPRCVRMACGEHPTILVLDNCEHVLDAAPLIVELLASGASLRLLATSRAALHVRGERQFVVSPLSLHPEFGESSINDWPYAPAVRLFAERVRDVQPEFCLTPENGPAVTAICERLDGLPLALELAAPWMKVLTVADLRDRLVQNALFSTAGARDLPARQQTINAAVAWSYRLLDRDSKRAFRRFGALRGSFSLDAGAAVLGGREGVAAIGEALNAVASLIDKSLLQRVESSAATRSQYQMLQTVHAYARHELAASGEHDDAMEGLVLYCAQELPEASVGLAGLDQAHWLDRIRGDLESYRAILEWLIDRGRSAQASDIAWNLGLFFLVRGYTAEGLHWYERVLDSTILSPSAESKARTGAGIMHWAQGALDLGRAQLTRALDIARDVGAADLGVHAENVLGHIEHAAGDLEAARQHYRHSLEGYRALAIQWGIGSALSGMAGVTLTAGDVPRAQRLLDEAAEALRNVGPWFLTPVLCFRAILSVRNGDPDLAIALMRESLTRIRVLQDKFAFVYALVPLAAAAALKGHYVWTARILGARDAVAESTGAAIIDSGVHHVRLMAEQQARTVLGADGWSRAYAAGRTASIDSLLTDTDFRES